LGRAQSPHVFAEFAAQFPELILHFLQLRRIRDRRLPFFAKLPKLFPPRFPTSPTLFPRFARIFPQLRYPGRTQRQLFRFAFVTNGQRVFLRAELHHFHAISAFLDRTPKRPLLKRIVQTELRLPVERQNRPKFQLIDILLRFLRRRGRSAFLAFPVRPPFPGPFPALLRRKIPKLLALLRRHPARVALHRG